MERERATARKWPSFSLLIRTRRRTRKLSNTPFIELKSVSFAYEAESKNALNNISLKIYEGERVVILGHNGSGKSTLAKIMGALQNPLQGVCLIKNRDVREIKFEDLRTLIGMLFQNPDNQIIASVLEDDIAFAPENQGLNSNLINKLVNHAIKITGLENKAGGLTSEMSGGEKQRMALAGAVAAQVKCLILDEPTAMLDPEGRVQVEKVIKDLHKSGVTIIQITHQLEFFDDKNNLDVDRVLVLSHGELVWEGEPEKFLPLAESMGFEKFERPVSLEELKNILAENKNLKLGEAESLSVNARQEQHARFKSAELKSSAEYFNCVEGEAESLNVNASQAQHARLDSSEHESSAENFNRGECEAES
ncbi:MAG: ATP-binding cassette domain-containing protein, partial [Synergistaceae bacterium]|nr:ATP-binding cassette domain-containing protein [Synergistaceae bacterium]